MKRLSSAQIDEMRQKFEEIRKLTGNTTLSLFEKVENALLKGADPQKILDIVRTIPENYLVFETEMEGILSTFFFNEEYKYVVEKIVCFRTLLFILRAIKQGLKIDYLVNPLLRTGQIFQVYLGLSEGLDVSAYAIPEFHEDKMSAIRRGMFNGYINNTDIAEIINNDLTTDEIFDKYIYPKQFSKKERKNLKK